MPKCRTCKAPTAQRFGLTYACSIDHALQYVNAQAAKRERTRLRQRKAALKTLPQLTREAQAEFNAFIRERDKDLPCISCGDFTPMTRGGDYDCGHYRSVGANPELRFHEQNANKQCKRCNGHLSGNIANYRIGLLMKYGESVVAEIEGPHELLKRTKAEAIAIKKRYSAKYRELKKARLDDE